MIFNVHGAFTIRGYGIYFGLGFIIYSNKMLVLVFNLAVTERVAQQFRIRLLHLITYEDVDMDLDISDVMLMIMLLLERIVSGSTNPGLSLF